MTSERSSDSDQQASTDNRDDKLTDDTAHCGAKDRHQDEVADDGPDDSEDNVHEQSVARVHNLAGKPAGHGTDDDCQDPTDSNHFGLHNLLTLTMARTLN